MKGPYIPSQRETLYVRWETLAENVYYEKTDVEEFKTLVYDTFEYFRQNKE